MLPLALFQIDTVWHLSRKNKQTPTNTTRVFTVLGVEKSKLGVQNKYFFPSSEHFDWIFLNLKFLVISTVQYNHYTQYYKPVANKWLLRAK